MQEKWYFTYWAAEESVRVHSLIQVSWLLEAETTHKQFSKPSLLWSFLLMIISYISEYAWVPEGVKHALEV